MKRDPCFRVQRGAHAVGRALDGGEEGGLEVRYRREAYEEPRLRPLLAPELDLSSSGTICDVGRGTDFPESG